MSRFLHQDCRQRLVRMMALLLAPESERELGSSLAPVSEKESVLGLGWLSVPALEMEFPLAPASRSVL